MTVDKKGFLDRAQEKALSRKFLVFIMTSVFLILGFVTAETWTMIAVAYVGTQGFADMISNWRLNSERLNE